MIGGLIFIFVVWFIPLIIWYIVQGKKEMEKDPNCPAEESEKKQTKNIIYFALGFGFLVMLLVLIFAS